MVRKVSLLLALGSGLLLAGARPAQAQGKDIAICVGINEYTKLARKEWLEGCVNDAATMKETLEKYGFVVKTLNNEQATREGILNALKEVGGAGRVRRFTFYFAGHGANRSDRTTVLLPQDAEMNAEDNDLPRDTLFTAISSVKAAHKTVILDSCFSGGMLKSTRALNNRARKTRFVERFRRGNEKNLVKVNGQDKPDIPSEAGSICYYAGALHNQQAAEDDFENRGRHGVFTNFLTQRLTGKRELWKDVDTDVTGYVKEHMFGLQQPVMVESFKSKPVFGDTSGGGNDPEPKPKPRPSTLWDDFNKKNVDATKLQLNLSENKTTWQVGEKLNFNVKVGQEGYLALMEYGTDGNIVLLFPESQNADDAKVAAGEAVRLPREPDKMYAPDAPGTEALRAVLFRSRAHAQQFIDKFQGAKRSIPMKATRNLTKVKVQGGDSDIYTSELSFEVTN